MARIGCRVSVHSGHSPVTSIPEMSSQPAVPNAIPDWFTRAIACEPDSRFALVDGARIHYLSWNAQDVHKPALLFAHGFRAHARWWSFIAPFFLSRFRVAALDFAGMGDSDARESYDAAQFSKDIIGVIEHGQFGRTTLVGHSFGGSRVLRASADHASHIERAVVIDSYVPLPEFERRGPPMMELRPKRVYASVAAARERFRLVPEHNCAAEYILDYVARHSMKQVEGGWSWKFDEKVLPRQIEASAQPAHEVLGRIQIPFTLIYGDLSVVVSRASAHAIVKRIRQGRGPIAIPQSHHHVLLDQPLALVSALKGILY